jgi:hypothetical protein
MALANAGCCQDGLEVQEMVEINLEAAPELEIRLICGEGRTKPFASRQHFRFSFEQSLRLGI